MQGKDSGDIDVPSKDGLDISVDDYEQEQEMLQSPPKISDTQLNADLPAVSFEAAVEPASVGNEANEKLTEEITDRILAQMLQEELSEDGLKIVFSRQVSPKP